jgi:cell division protein FtsQ
VAPRNRLAVITGFVTLTAAIAAAMWGAHEWRAGLTVKRIIIEGNHTVPSAEILQLTQVRSGARLYGIDLQRIRENVLKQLYVKSVTVERVLPDGLRVMVTERQPIAAIVRGGTSFLDEEGILLPDYRLFDVPFVTGFLNLGQWAPGQPASSQPVLYALSLLNRAREMDPELYHMVSEIHMTEDGDAILYSSDEGIPILFGKKDEERKFSMLIAFWKRFVRQRGADQLRLVDLRYEDQVIARWKTRGEASREKRSI